MAKTIRLKPIIHDRKSTLWCGPGVVSALTGQPTSVIHEHMTTMRSAVDEPSRVIGTNDYDILWTLTQLGYMMRPLESEAVTFGDWLDDYKRNPKAGYIIMIERGDDKHWVTVVRRMFCDTTTSTPVPVKDALYRECLYINGYEVRKVG